MVSNINLKIEDDLEIALKASKKAGDIIMNYYKHDYEINEKGYHNPVTTADKEADSFLKSTLLDARPDYGWLSEETIDCLLYTSPSPRDRQKSRMPSSA